MLKLSAISAMSAISFYYFSFTHTLVVCPRAQYSYFISGFGAGNR